MTSKQTFSIETASKDKVRDFILTEFSSKINYCKIQRFSNQERFGKDNEDFTTKIDHLQFEKESLLKWLDTATNVSHFSVSLNLVIKEA